MNNLRSSWKSNIKGIGTNWKEAEGYCFSYSSTPKFDDLKQLSHYLCIWMVSARHFCFDNGWGSWGLGLAGPGWLPHMGNSWHWQLEDLGQSGGASQFSRWPLHIAWASHNMVASIQKGISQESVFQEGENKNCQILKGPELAPHHFCNSHRTSPDFSGGGGGESMGVKLTSQGEIWWRVYDHL